MFHARLIPLLLLLFPLFAAAAIDERDLLQPDQAFQISGRADGPGRVVVSWRIADGYYMYRSKFRFESDTPGIELAAPELPPGKVKHDEFFGELEVYRDRVEIAVPLERGAAAPSVISIKTRSQGCADAGFCFPPHSQKVLVELPPATAQPAAATPLGGALGFGVEDDILDPEEAYRFTAVVAGPERLQLDWQIAQGTYLYRDKLEVALEGADSVALAPYVQPPGKVKHDTIRPDGTIGDIEVYIDAVALPLELVRTRPEATSVTLIAKYQGCAERGICYPPITKRVALELPALGSAAAATPVAGGAPTAAPTAASAVPAAPRSETDRLADTLSGGSGWLIVATFFGLGLLLALTPCVFPMIPILSGIIAGHGADITTRKAFTLSLVYVLAMALTYTVVGVLAGLFGANLQAAFQDPWILSAFALLFVALALSMFGFYELQLPSSWQGRLSELSNRQQGGSYAGVAIMGLLSALIVGPCVAPPLAGALIYIGQTGDALLGGLALFALAMGMGAPLIAIGSSAGKLLPRAGGWMETIKAVFGVLLLAVAIVMLERIVPAAVAMVLWGTLMISSAVYMGALARLPDTASGWRRLWQGLGVVLLIYGALMLVGAAAGGRDTVQPLRGILPAGGGEAAHLQFKRIKSVADLDREVAAASAAGRPVMLDFYADWCVACKEMERYTFSEPEVITALSGFVLLQADVTANDATDQALLQGRFGIPGPPLMAFFGPDGAERRHLRVVGFMPADEFAVQIRQAAQ